MGQKVIATLIEKFVEIAKGAKADARSAHARIDAEERYRAAVEARLEELERKVARHER